MTAIDTTTTTALPAAIGGEPRFPAGLPLVRPAMGEVSGLVSSWDEIARSGMLTNGSTVRRLEEVVSERLGGVHVIAVSSCTSGLMLTLQALDGTGPVVMPSFTFSASAHAVHWSGGTPEFTEVDEQSLTLDPAAARRRLEELGGDARMMTATHIYGTPCDTEALQQVADDAGVPLVYDAAHGLGSVHQGTPVGNFGAAEVFSLSPTKVVVAGEGGLVATRDPDLAARLRMARDYGNPGDYDTRFPGINARMSELHAATAIHSLSLLDSHLRRRKELVDLFWDRLGPVAGVRGPALAKGDVSTYKDLTVIIDAETTGISAEDLGVAIKRDGIDSRRYYYPPIHRQQSYSHLPPVELPVTDRLSHQVLSPPLWSSMTDDDVIGIAETMSACLADPVRTLAVSAERAPAGVR